MSFNGLSTIAKYIFSGCKYFGISHGHAWHKNVTSGEMMEVMKMSGNDVLDMKAGG